MDASLEHTFLTDIAQATKYIESKKYLDEPTKREYIIAFCNEQFARKRGSLPVRMRAQYDKLVTTVEPMVDYYRLLKQFSHSVVDAINSGVAEIKFSDYGKLFYAANNIKLTCWINIISEFILPTLQYSAFKLVEKCDYQIFCSDEPTVEQHLECIVDRYFYIYNNFHTLVDSVSDYGHISLIKKEIAKKLKERK